MTLLLVKIVFWVAFCVFILTLLTIMRYLPDDRGIDQGAAMILSNVIITLFMFALHYGATIAYPRETRALDDYVGNVLSSMKYFIIQQKIIYLNKTDINNLRG